MSQPPMATVMLQSQGRSGAWTNALGWSGARTWVAAAILTTTVLSFFRLGDKSLWYDEAFTVKWVYSPMERLTDFIRDVEPFNGLYYLWAKAWSLAQTSDVWLRVPSAVLAIATIPAIYLLAHALAGDRAARYTAMFAAVSGFLISMAQEARSYTLVIFIVTVTSLVLVKAIQRPTPVRWLVYGIVAGIAVWVHVWVVFVILAHGIAAMSAVLLSPAIRIGYRSMIAGFVAAAAVTGPILIQTTATVTLQPNWYPAITADAVVRSMLSLGGASVPRGLIGILPGAATLAAALGGIVVLVRRRAPDALPWTPTFLIACVLAPVLISGLFSIVRPIFVGRYLAVELPALMILAGIGIAAIPRRTLRITTVGLMVAIGLLGVALRYDSPKQDWRGASALIRTEALPDDAIVVFRDPGKTGLDVYLHGAGASAPFEPVVQTIPDPYHFSSAVAGAEGSHRRIWFVLFPGGAGLSPDTRQMLLDDLGRTHHESSVHAFVDLEVRLFVPTSTNGRSG